MAPTLVSFDVDGTLIRARGASANAFHKAAFAAAFADVYGLDASIDEIDHHGSTDQLVLLAVLAHRKVPAEEAEAKIPAACARMVEYARAAAAHEVSAGLEVLPGVEALLAAIEGAGVERAVSCLVTGNLEDIAWAKMRALGVEGRFSAPRFGGFGSDARDRAELVAAAASRCASAHAAPGARFHLGDTPNDVRAAEACGATPIALLTGVFGEAELRASSKAPDDLVVLEDLADTDAVMRVLGLNA